MKEELYTMNEIKIISIIQLVIDKKRTQKDSAKTLSVSDRQIRKFIKYLKNKKNFKQLLLLCKSSFQYKNSY